MANHPHEIGVDKDDPAWAAGWEFAAALEDRADSNDFNVHMWMAWAIRKAFWAGCLFGRANPYEKGDG